MFNIDPAIYYLMHICVLICFYNTYKLDHTVHNAFSLLKK